MQQLNNRQNGIVRSKNWFRKMLWWTIQLEMLAFRIRASSLTASLTSCESKWSVMTTRSKLVNTTRSSTVWLTRLSTKCSRWCQSLQFIMLILRHVPVLISFSPWPTKTAFTTLRKTTSSSCLPRAAQKKVTSRLILWDSTGRTLWSSINTWKTRWCVIQMMLSRLTMQFGLASSSSSPWPSSFTTTRASLSASYIVFHAILFKKWLQL